MKQQISFTSGYEKFRRYYRSIEPMMEKPKNRVYTAVIFSFLAIALFAWYAIRPTIQTIIYLQREITDKSKVNQQMEDKITSLIEAQNSFEEAQNLLPALDDAIPSSPDAIDAIFQIKNLVSTTQATLSSVRVSNVALISEEDKQTKKSDAKEFLVSLSVSGIYQEVEAFLQSLLSMRRIFTIEQITLAPETDNMSISIIPGKIIKLTLQLKAYYK